MIRISELAMPLDSTTEDLKRAAAKRLGVSASELANFRIARKSVDARKKQDVHFVYTVLAELGKKEGELLKKRGGPKLCAEKPLSYRVPEKKKPAQPPVVAGFGPAGMFAALLLAQAGLCPIVFERGAPVEARQASVAAFRNGGAFSPDANIQFGEGGAGTFSDGKLTTGTHDPRARKVLAELAAAGAPEEILYEAKPHIGTDRLPGVVREIRQEILRLGGQVQFYTALTGLEIRDGRLCKVEVTRQGAPAQTFPCSALVLSVGHSARDTFSMLYGKKLPIEPKPFSIGVRIEHPQTCINKAQYGSAAGHPALGAADYKLNVHLPNGRGVYTFCMCPGGSVVCASSEAGGVVTNGMSPFARDGENANAALLVGVQPEDFGSNHPLAGIALQRRLEQQAFTVGGGGYAAPVQRVEDFLQRRKSRSFGSVQPSYLPGVALSAMDDCLPEWITESLREGILRLDGRLHGFAFPDALLTGVETRSSSPVRVLRGEHLCSPKADGLFPCGEGAGYAGGIVSAAVDGIRCAEKVMERYE